MLDICSGGNHSSATLAGFIGEDAALYSHHYGRTEDAAAQRVNAEGVGENLPQQERNLLRIAGQDHQCHNDIAQRHERSDYRCYVSNSPDTSDDDYRQQHCQPDAGGKRGDAIRIKKCLRSAVGLNSRQEQTISYKCDDSED